MGMVSFPVTSTPASHQNSIKLGDTFAKCEQSLLSVLLLVITYIDRYEHWMKYFEKKLGDTMAKCKHVIFVCSFLLVIILIDINTG